LGTAEIIFERSEHPMELLYGGKNSNARSIYVVKVIMFIGEDGQIINTSYYV
jgi:hypothetical protein